MSGTYEDVKGRLKDLWKGKTLTPEEKIDVLEKIYCASLIQLAEKISARKMSGTGALTSILERTRLEIADLRSTHILGDNRYTNILSFNLETGKICDPRPVSES
jgi:hypothetical protein